MLVFLDSCVILSRLPRELMLLAARQGAFELAYSQSVENESMHVASRKGMEQDIAAAFVDLRLLAKKLPSAADLPGFWLPDENDRHVGLSAIAANAQIIATENLRDFPKTAFEPFGIVVQNPDQILTQALIEGRFVLPDNADPKTYKNAKLYRLGKHIGKNLDEKG